MAALLAAALLTLTFPQAAAADDNDPPGRVARLNYIQGSVSFQPAGEPDWVSAVINRPMTTGDRLWTDQGARAELHTGSATIRLDGGTGFSFLNLDDRTVQIQLTEGTLDIRVQRLGRDEIFEVDTSNQAFSILRPGQYRLQASEDGNSTFVTVRSGEGESTGGGQIYTLHAGQSGTFTGTDYLYGDIYNAGRNDDFDDWGQSRDRHDDESQSARYVSPDVVGYQDLDDYGSWRSDPGYGNVWVPTRVASDWAPYRDGHWAWISPWGWTWVDDAPWGYAPFHYGRWVSIRGSWGWVPGPRQVQPVYAPALVVFIGGPQFGVSDSRGRGGYGGNVGWFPLGPREVYVPGYNASRGYVDRVNVSNTTVSSTTITTVYNNRTTNNINITNVTYANRTVRGGVTAVPQNTFTSAQPVARAAVAVNPQQIASAPVTSRAAVAPTRNSVLGTSAHAADHVAQPPAAIANRSVVAKAPPPPPPVAFAKQQQALAVHPGQPLARHEVESLRPANVPAEHPMVKQAPPGKPATPNTNRPVSQPANAQPSNAPASKPANVQANVPAEKPQPVRGDRPPSAQQQADKAREQQAVQQQAEKTREQQAAQQQAEKTREQQAAQQQAEKAHEQQAVQQQTDKARQQQAAQQQAEKAHEQQAAQQQAEKTREQQAAQQQAVQQQTDKARQQQAAQQQAEKTREQQAAQQQAEKAHEQQAVQQQTEKTRQQQAAQQQAEKAYQQQADKAREEQAAQKRSDRPPSTQPVQPSKAQPVKSAEAPQTQAQKDKAREEQKKKDDKPTPQ